jgi:outer membrane protein TolC
VWFEASALRAARDKRSRLRHALCTSLVALLLPACQAGRQDVTLALTSCAPMAGETGTNTACADLPPSEPRLATSLPLPRAAAGSEARTVGSQVDAGQAVSRTALVVPPSLRAQAGPAGNSVADPAPAALPPGIGPATTSSLNKQPERPARTSTRQIIRLNDAVASAVMQYPEIAINKARVREAAAGIDIATSAIRPSADLRVAAGGNHSGSYEGRAIPYATAGNAVDARFDGGLILRQLIFDFGAAQTDIDRASYQRDAEKMKLREKIDEIAHKTAQTYLRILEQRSLVALVDETIAAHENLARIVQAHAREGHGTVADVQRVNSRLVDIRAIRSDVSLQLMAAEDLFERLTRARPGRLTPVPQLNVRIPASAESAVQRMLTNNPRLAAIAATRRSTQKELEYNQANMLPKINLELETESKNYRNGQLGRTQLEGRAMLAMRYRLMDGGLGQATSDQVNARLEGQEMTYLNEREQFEADIRQAYRAIDSAKRKERLLGDGVNSATKVRELYMEQFKGGKRTIFELLDGQMSYYTARRSQIEGQFEGRRAVFDILRATGELTLHLSRQS